MSQAGIISTTSGPVPPTVPTSFVTDVNSPAIPAANVLNVPGGQTSINNNNGIQTDGSSGSNTLTSQLTNRITGTATTNDAVTVQTIYSFPAGLIPGTYLLEVRVIGFNVTSNLSAGYTSYRVIRTDGATATLISANPGIISEEGAMTGVIVTNGTSANNITLTVQGYNADVIHWRALTTYVFVS